MTTDRNTRRVEYLSLADLEPDERNPKAHDTDLIDASIGRFGMLDPIVRDERTGKLIAGHGRRKALLTMMERGETAPEGVQVTPDGTWLVPVVTGWASRTDSESAAALIALNRTTEVGGWVDGELLDLLQALDADDDGLAGVGFSSEDVAALAQVEDGPDFSDLESMTDDAVAPPTERPGTQVECPSCHHTFEV